jgi:hypothetical protein
LVIFYEKLDELGLEAHTIGTNVESLSSPFDEVVALMNKCDCTIVLGIPQIKVQQGTIKDEDIGSSFSFPTEWNQIEAAMSIMLGKPTLMMLHRSVANRGLFERGAANVFVHDFHTVGPKWIENMIPKLQALKERANA